MSTEQTYKNVAEHCSAFNAKESDSYQNKDGDCGTSCLCCKHFAEDHHCELDLVDPIVENHNF